MKECIREQAPSILQALAAHQLKEPRSSSVCFSWKRSLLISNNPIFEHRNLKTQRPKNNYLNLRNVWAGPLLKLWMHCYCLRRVLLGYSSIVVLSKAAVADCTFNCRFHGVVKACSIHNLILVCRLYAHFCFFCSRWTGAHACGTLNHIQLRRKNQQSLIYLLPLPLCILHEN